VRQRPLDAEDPGTAPAPNYVIEQQEIRNQVLGPRPLEIVVPIQSVQGWNMEEHGNENGRDCKWVDSKNASYVEVEYVRLALERPHEYEAGMHKEHEDAYDPRPRALPAPDPAQAHRKQYVVNDDRQDGDTSNQSGLDFDFIAPRSHPGFQVLPGVAGSERGMLVFLASDMDPARLAIRVEVIAVPEQ